MTTVLSVFLKIKNNHLNQAIHEEREAIIELRVQLRLLQLQRARPEPQAQDDDEPERRGGAVQPPRDSALETKAAKELPKAGKEQAKPSPSRDRKETPIWAALGHGSPRPNKTCASYCNTKRHNSAVHSVKMSFLLRLFLLSYVWLLRVRLRLHRRTKQWTHYGLVGDRWLPDSVSLFKD